jgi:hypothetical protein
MCHLKYAHLSCFERLEASHTNSRAITVLAIPVLDLLPNMLHVRSSRPCSPGWDPNCIRLVGDRDHAWWLDDARTWPCRLRTIPSDSHPIPFGLRLHAPTTWGFTPSLTVTGEGRREGEGIREETGKPGDDGAAALGPDLVALTSLFKSSLQRHRS